MDNKFASGAILRSLRLADRYAGLFGGTEFIVLDVLFKTVNAGALKKTEVIQSGAPTEGCTF